MSREIVFGQGVAPRTGLRAWAGQTSELFLHAYD